MNSPKSPISPEGVTQKQTMSPGITQSPKIPTTNMTTLSNNKITKTSTIKSKTTQNTIQSNNINLKS